MSLLGEQLTEVLFLPGVREGASPKGDLGSCLDGDSDSVLFVEKMRDMIPSTEGLLDTCSQNIPSGVRFLSQRASSREGNFSP